MLKRWKVELSLNSLDDLLKDIKYQKKDLLQKQHEIVDKLTIEGERIAKEKMSSMGISTDGELYHSVKREKESDIPRGRVYTDLDYAKFVEYGTGIVGQANPHVDPPVSGWTYDINEHGESGWVYFDKRLGDFRRTKGIEQRPFMYETSKELKRIATNVAKEVMEND